MINRLSHLQFRKKIPYYIFIILLISCFSQNSSAQQGELTRDHRVLILTSYGDGRPGVDALLSGFFSALNVKGISIEQVYIEHLDLQRNKDLYFINSLTQTLRLKYLSKRIDLIYVAEQPALDFLINNLHGIAPGATVIVVRAVLPHQAEINGWHIIQQLNSYDITRTMKLAQAVFPHTKEIICITGSTPSDRAIAAQASLDIKAIAPEIVYQDTTGMTLSRVKTLVASPPPSSVIIVLPFNSDSDGKTAVQMEIAFMISQEAKAPVFTLWDNPVGRGAVGGAVTDFVVVGKQAGQYGFDILSHTLKPDTIQSLPSISTLKLDWKQLTRWNGQSGNLPSETIVINRPISLWEHYRNLVIGVLTLIVLQTAFIIALIVQISLRRRTQKILAQSRDNFKLLIEQAPEAIIVYDTGTDRVIDANVKAEELFGCTKEYIKEHGILPFYMPIQPDGQLPTQSFYLNIKNVESTKNSLILRSIKSARGQEYLCEVRLVLLPSVGAKLVRASFIDITARVRAEDDLRRSLAEKEILLQEVYHRTKNNMQVIAALIDMESMQIEDVKMKTLLLNMQGRIKAMALVHQKLYQSKDLSRINIKEYIKDLVSQIVEGSTKKTNNIKIELNLEEGIVSVLDIAIPCGLVLNELLSNAYKHAFNDGREGTIAIVLKLCEDASLYIEVADNGIGFPSGFDPRNDGGMGFKMMFAIVEMQLHGSISFTSQPGTNCIIQFKDNLYSPRI